MSCFMLATSAMAVDTVVVGFDPEGASFDASLGVLMRASGYFDASVVLDGRRIEQRVEWNG